MARVSAVVAVERSGRQSIWEQQGASRGARPSAEAAGIATTSDAAWRPTPVEQRSSASTNLTTAVRKRPSRFSGRSCRGCSRAAAVRRVLCDVGRAAAVPCGMLLGWRIGNGSPPAWASQSSVTVGLLAWLWPIARRQSGQQFQSDSAVAGRRAAGGCKPRSKRPASAGEREAQALVTERDQQSGRRRSRSCMRSSASASGGRKREIGRAGQTFPQRLAQLRGELDRDSARRPSRSMRERWRW